MYRNLSGEMDGKIFTVCSTNVCGTMGENIGIFHKKCVKLVADLKGCGRANTINSLSKISGIVGHHFSLCGGCQQCKIDLRVQHELVQECLANGANCC